MLVSEVELLRAAPKQYPQPNRPQPNSTSASWDFSSHSLQVHQHCTSTPFYPPLLLTFYSCLHHTTTIPSPSSLPPLLDHHSRQTFPSVHAICAIHPSSHSPYLLPYSLLLFLPFRAAFLVLQLRRPTDDEIENIELINFTVGLSRYPYPSLRNFISLILLQIPSLYGLHYYPLGSFTRPIAQAARRKPGQTRSSGMRDGVQSSSQPIAFGPIRHFHQPTNPTALLIIN